MLPSATNGVRGCNAGLGDRLLAANGNNYDGARHVFGAKAKYWVPADEKEMAASQECGGEEGRPLLYRTFKVKGILMNIYRLLNVARLAAVMVFFVWRVKHQASDAMWLWWISVVGDLWFGVSWWINQVPKLNPVICIPSVPLLAQRFDSADGGSSRLPLLDVFINTVDPVAEPMLHTMNSILSILAADYPVDKYATYLSDDGGSLLHYDGLAETAKFAALWVPFCRKHRIEPRAPESYFGAKTRPSKYTGNAPQDFVDDHGRLRREYEEFKARLDALFIVIPQRSEVYGGLADTKGGGTKATWMADGTQWPGTWIEPAEDHRKGDHTGIFQVMLYQPNNEPELGMAASSDNPLDFSGVDVRLPMLVYISREKRPGYDHQKKAGAMNVQLRVSAVLSNAPFIINFDCDHYINNSQAFRAAMCFMMDRRGGDNTGFVQFPQRFDDVDQTDRYCNHNRVFFDATMLGMNGIQAPSNVGTGCMFRRVALYGADPPRWRLDDVKVLEHNPNRFGRLMPFVNSIPVAANQERSIMSPLLQAAASLDEDQSASMADVMACAYEDGTEWGDGVGWVYDMATEDAVTGFRLHRAGWRSMYCDMEPHAFRGTAPINLTERMYQILRWSGGSLEVFFSRFCPLLPGGPASWRRLHPMQRVAYTNMTAYPLSALFVVCYHLLPLMWLFQGQFYIQKPYPTYLLYVLAVIVLNEVVGMVEIVWAGLTLLDWFRNEQFYMICATGVYQTAVLHIVLRALGLKGVSFKMTAKQLAGGARERFAELYHMQWAPLLLPTVVVIAVNVVAIGAAVGKAVTWGWSAAQVAEAAIGLSFNVWILLMFYPFALGLMGRWSKRPYVLFAMLLAAFAAIASVYVAAEAVLAGSVPHFHQLGHWQTARIVKFLRRASRQV